MFLTVPVGPDVLVWNLHRRYGRTRFPLLLAGFSTVRAFGFHEGMMSKPANWRQTYEPVFVLRALPANTAARLAGAGGAEAAGEERTG